MTRQQLQSALTSVMEFSPLDLRLKGALLSPVAKPRADAPAKPKFDRAANKAAVAKKAAATAAAAAAAAKKAAKPPYVKAIPQATDFCYRHLMATWGGGVDCPGNCGRNHDILTCSKAELLPAAKKCSGPKGALVLAHVNTLG